ncbi:hypothetical protein pb186bvf_007589 [Paramecium bursaria]
MNRQLRGRPSKKLEKSHNYFKDTKITTCSYVKRVGDDFYAIPFYERPKQKYEEVLNKSMYTTSTSKEAYNNQRICHSSMDKKPLIPYDPNAKRSRLQTPTFKYVNRAEIEIGDRSIINQKHYQTMNQNHIGNFGITSPCANQCILAERSKWNHHLKECY